MSRQHYHETNIIVKVVLLANGIGSNPQTYRPNADESQWWNRRDALVRCVTAFFFCSTKISDSNKSRSTKEIIILFDEDWSYFSMKCLPSTTTINPQIPCESNIIQLWKCSAHNPGVRIRYNDLGLSCLCVNSDTPVTTLEPNSTTDIESIIMPTKNNVKRHSRMITTTTSSDITGSDSNNKRTLLEYLQTNCSMEFLRLHRYATT